MWMTCALRSQSSQGVPDGRDFLKGKKILILSPHPDDEVIGCFNLCAAMEKENIDIVIMSSHEGKAVLNSIRRGESVDAIGGLVNSISFLEIPDGRFSDASDEISRFLESVTEKYDYFLTPAPNDLTPDHSALAKSEAIMALGCKLIWYRSTWWTFRASNASFLFKGSLQKKNRALSKFRSQRSLALKAGNILSSKLLNNESREYFMVNGSGQLEKIPQNSISFRTAISRSRWL
jgi:hypothetical protein